MKILFIGGVMNGRTRRMVKTKHIIVPSLMRDYAVFGEPSSRAMIGTKYRKATIRSIDVMILDSMTDKDAMAALVEGYIPDNDEGLAYFNESDAVPITPVQYLTMRPDTEGGYFMSAEIVDELLQVISNGVRSLSHSFKPFANAGDVGGHFHFDVPLADPDDQPTTDVTIPAAALCAPKIPNR